MARRPLTGVLLVGGASRRFGSPKALASFRGESLAERGWNVLGEACDERLAVGKAAEPLDLPFAVLDDAAGEYHPAAGIAAALRVARHEVCVVLPVDCPCVTPDALRALGEACADAAWPAGAGPLPGAFARSTLPAFERCVAELSSIRRALAGADVRHVELDPALLADADTAAALAAIEAAPER